MQLVLVTGAGASRELGDGKPLPLMPDWANALCEALDAKEGNLAAAAKLAPGLSGMEFEEALGLLLRWEQVRHLEERFSGLGGPHPGSQAGDVPASRQRMDARMAVITSTINESLYDQFGMTRVADRAATEAYGGLLRALEELDEVEGLVVATTNYDRAIEAGLRGNDLTPETGFGPPSERSRSLDPSGLAERYMGDHKVVPVLHLHGAVGWYEKDGQVYDRLGDLPFNPTLGTPVVLYPDPEKDPTSDAAVEMLWREFRTALNRANRVLVLGHSLNDAALVREIRSLPEATKVGVTVLEGTDDEWVRDKVPDASVIPATFGPDLRISGAAMKAFAG